jgi:hypothetical protein
MKTLLHAGDVPSCVFKAKAKSERSVFRLLSGRFRPGGGRRPFRRPGGMTLFGRTPLGKKPTVRLGLGEKMGKRCPNAGFETPFPLESVGKTAIRLLLFFSCVTGDYPLAITGLADPSPSETAEAGPRKRKFFSQSARNPVEIRYSIPAARPGFPAAIFRAANPRPRPSRERPGTFPASPPLKTPKREVNGPPREGAAPAPGGSPVILKRKPVSPTNGRR